MNIELIREQLKGIEVEEICMADEILNKIRARKQKRRLNLRVAAIIACLFISIGTIQFQQISAFAESLYRNIIISLNNDTIVINNLGTTPIELKGFSWLGSKGTRIGTKYYPGIKAVEEELGISVLYNPISVDMNRHTQIPLIYFESRNIAELIFHRHFIGDLKNYNETILENGDLQYSYETDDTIYKSPLSMTISLITGSGGDLENHNWEFFDYEEKYISPVNGITAYLMKYAGSIGLGDEKIALRSAAGETNSIIVFANDNLLYTISGNVPSDEMKRIVDGFIISD